ncbi:MAG: hypothetical protein GTO22_14385 [Gemmatimonadales bacterium]|nr:hypothetical protein [Gemmatimonadales bacterium]
MAEDKKPPVEPRTTDEILEEHKKDVELTTLRAEQRRLVKDLLLERKRNRVLDELANTHAPKIRPSTPTLRKGLREATAVVLCSDWHVEEPVEPEKVSGLNEYNLDIAEQRIRRLVSGVCWLLEMHQTKFQIQDLVVWLGGDLFSGYIHEELEESNLLSPVQSVLWLEKRIVEMLDAFLSNTKLRITVVCSIGNHGRTTKKRRIATAWENSYEWLMYEHLADRATHPRVKWVHPRSALTYLDVYDFRLRFCHGDDIRYGGGVGGISIPVNKAVDAWNKSQRADVTCFGHWHQYFDSRHWVGNGSLIGYTPFAVAIKASYEPPQQAFFLVDFRRGKCCSTPIWVSERPT